MKPDQLAAIRARTDAATLGPWNLSADGETITQTTHVTRDVWTIPRTVADMAFIAHARDDVPDLLEDVDLLMAQLQDYERASRLVYKGWGPTTSDLPTRAMWDEATATIDLIAQAVGLEMEGHDGPVLAAVQQLVKERARYRAALDAIRRANSPKGGCLAECASNTNGNDDCDCGYIYAGMELADFVAETLRENS